MVQKTKKRSTLREDVLKFLSETSDSMKTINKEMDKLGHLISKL